jgi:hypothetical protein
MAARRGLRLQDDRHVVEDTCLTDDLGAVVSNTTLIRRCRKHGRITGNRLRQGDLADVMQQGGILQVENVSLSPTCPGAGPWHG